LDLSEHHREPERQYGLKLREIAAPFLLVLAALLVGYFLTLR
jgi:hypothetical protein